MCGQANKEIFLPTLIEEIYKVESRKVGSCSFLPTALDVEYW